MLLENFELLATAPAGVARLRELILTLAVQGKLVPQDPADEPASVLLQGIRAEKVRLIAEGRIKRDKPRTDISDDETAHELPEQWLWVRLGDIATKLTDGSHNPPRDAGSGFPMLSSQNVWEGGVIDFSSPTRYVNADDFAIENARTTAAPGDVLLTIVASLGRSAVVPDDAPAFVLQRSVAVIRSNILPGYLALFLRSPVARAFYDEHGKGTAQKGIYLGKLGTLPVPVPPLAEQARIVARVEELMCLCDALEANGRLEAAQHAQLVSTLLGALTGSETPEALAANWQRVAAHFDLVLDRPEAVDALEQTLLQLAVRGLLVPQDPSDEPASALLQRIRAEKDRLIAEGQIKRDRPLSPVVDNEKPFDMPQGWEWVRFGQIAEIASNLVSPAQHSAMWQVAPDCIEKGTGRLLFRRTVAEAEVVSPNHLFQPGQILYSKIRPSLSKAVIVDFPGLCSADMYPINSILNPQYLLMYILSGSFLEQVRAAENRVKMPKLNQEALTSFLVATPPMGEQARIVARVQALRRLCADLRQRLTAGRTAQTQLAEALVAGMAA